MNSPRLNAVLATVLSVVEVLLLHIIHNVVQFLYCTFNGLWHVLQFPLLLGIFQFMVQESSLSAKSDDTDG
jgi:hypothetical protein